MENTPDKEDWEENIRTDLWPTMSIQQLNVQRDLVVSKISLLYTMSIGDPTVRNLLGALQIAIKDLNDLIDNRAEQQQQKRIII